MEVAAVQLVWFWPDQVFTQARKKIPCRLPSVLYGMAEKVMEAQYWLFPCFHSPGLTRLETRYSGARDETNTHGMETGLMRTVWLMDQSIRVMVMVYHPLTFPSTLRARRSWNWNTRKIRCAWHSYKRLEPQLLCSWPLFSYSLYWSALVQQPHRQSVWPQMLSRYGTNHISRV